MLADEVLGLLRALDGVRQSPRYHPEGDVLTHSLQVFDRARRDVDDRVLWAAALLHDVGKVFGAADHELTGADLLDGLVAPRIVWLVRHHLDLMRAPALTRRRHRHAPQLADLERLHRWDGAGRVRGAPVPSPEEAVALVLESLDLGAGGAVDHGAEQP